MTTEASPSRGARASDDTGGERHGVFGALQHALAQPLATYYILLGSCVLLLVIGLVMVLSASSIYSYNHYDGDSFAVVKRQLIGLAIAVPIAFVAARLPVKTFRRFAWLALILAVLLLVVTTFTGVSVAGNQNWLAVGPIQFQPSEVGKLAIVLWGAHILAERERYLSDWRTLLFPLLPGFGLAMLLVLIGHDLGTAIVFGVILVGMLWTAGAPLRVFGAVLVVMAVVVGLLAVTNPERMARLLSFRDPFSQFHDEGWQPAHGLYALASGGFFGRGIGESQQKWGDLAAAHTDFIFAVLGEELGLVGTLFILVLFLAFAYAALRVARVTTDPFIRYFTAGVVVWIIGQMMINIGMVLTFLPVIGIPLPLVSYGGSSLVPTLIALGVVVGFSRREPEAARALGMRRRGRSVGLSAR